MKKEKLLMAGKEGQSKLRDDRKEDQMKRKELVLKPGNLVESLEMAGESKK